MSNNNETLTEGHFNFNRDANKNKKALTMQEQNGRQYEDGPF